MQKRITILGSTGTIGVNTLDVIARYSDKFSVFALTANRNVELMLEQCQKWNPAIAVMVEADKAELLERGCAQSGLDTKVLSGVDALSQVAEHTETDYVMAGIVGAAGLLPSLAAAQACTNSGEAQKGPRFLSVRGIIGGADLDLPDNAVTHLFEPDASRPTGFLGKITGRFRKDPELAAWDKRAEETAGNLNRFLLATIRQLGDKIRNSG